MANITKRRRKDGSPSYLIRVFLDESGAGKQTVKSTTWKPPQGMKESAADKEAGKQAILFEDQVKKGLAAFDGDTKFQEYAEYWMQNAQISAKTREDYEGLLKRIDLALGHIRLEKLQARHIQAFYQNLREAGVKERGLHATSAKLDGVMKKRRLSGEKLGLLAGISGDTVRTARRGGNISVASAQKLSRTLDIPLDSLFTISGQSMKLSENTILHYHRLISAILAKAKKERLVTFNVASEFVEAPKVPRKEAAYLDDKEAQRFLTLLLRESDIRVKTAFVLLLFTGMRRGELCGLSWQDVHESSQIIRVQRASQYRVGEGIVEAPTKNASSVRSVKVPAFVIEVLQDYKRWWEKQRLAYGDAWRGQQQRLFIQGDGKPIYPGTINQWLRSFLEKHGMGHLTPHSLRHTFATLQIAAGVDIRTLQARTGHAQASTLINIYSHAIKSAQEAASDALEHVLLPTKE